MSIVLWPYGTTPESYEDDWNRCQRTTNAGTRCKRLIHVGQAHSPNDGGPPIARASDVAMVERGICAFHIWADRQP